MANDQIDLQADEFSALVKLTAAYTALPAVVDDDYPEARETYERAIQDFMRTLSFNRGRWYVGLSFGELRRANVSRCARWHPEGLNSWSLSDWAVAAAGEMGEACDLIKKLNRVRDGLVGNRADEAELRAALGKEIADTVIYLDLLAERAGIDLSAVIRAKFNEVSARNGFPERL